MDNKQKIEIIKKIHASWKAGNLTYKMHSGQLQIHQVLRNLPHGVRIRLMECCRGYGKTTLNVLMACEDCAQPHALNYPVRIIGPEKDQTVEIVAQIFDIITQEAPPGWIVRKASTWHVGNNRIIVSGFNRGSIERLRGKRAKSIYLEEIRDVPSEDFEYGMKAVILPMSLAVSCPVTAATTSPSKILHAMNTYFKPIAIENGGYFHFDIYDCPLYDEKAIKQAVKDCGGEDTEDFQREYLCQSVNTKVKRAVPAFDEKVHVKSFDLPSGDFKRWMITDIGGLRDPSHALIFFLGEDNVVRIRHELVFEPQTTTSIMVRELRALEEKAGIEDEGDKPVFMDCPGQFLVDLREEHLYACRSVNKGSFEESLKSLNQAFYDGMIEVHPDCKQLIYQLSTGMLNKQHTDFERDPGVVGSETYIGHHCDGVAAAMYGWRMRESPTIKQVHIDFGDYKWVPQRIRDGLFKGTDPLKAIKPKMRRF